MTGPVTPPASLRAAFAATPRAGFLPADQRRFAEGDRPLRIGWGQTNSQPRTVEAMLSLLDVRTGQRVLDVGAGSAWTTALLAHLTGPGGEVVGVEIVPELVAVGRANLAALDRPWARVEPALDGVLGRPDLAPFDRVLVSAMARRLPVGLVDQLRPHGLLVGPVAGELLVVRRTGRGPSTSRHGRYSFVPLVGG